MIGGKIDCNEYKYFPLSERNIKSYTPASFYFVTLIKEISLRITSAAKH